MSSDPVALDLELERESLEVVVFEGSAEASPTRVSSTCAGTNSQDPECACTAQERFFVDKFIPYNDHDVIDQLLRFAFSGSAAHRLQQSMSNFKLDSHLFSLGSFLLSSSSKFELWTLRSILQL